VWRENPSYFARKLCRICEGDRKENNCDDNRTEEIQSLKESCPIRFSRWNGSDLLRMLMKEKSIFGEDKVISVKRERHSEKKTSEKEQIERKKEWDKETTTRRESEIRIYFFILVEIKNKQW